MKNKDNPVPSLDIIKLKKQYLKENPRLHISHVTAIDSFASWLRQEIIIQNGVENYKEQPKPGRMTEISWGSKLHPDEKIG